MSLPTSRLAAVFSLSLLSCATLSPTPEPPRTTTVDDSPTGNLRSTPSREAPEISRSTGVEGGVVVFWPRLAPRSIDPEARELAAKLQARVAEVARKAAPGRSVEVRPEPERVCPRTGCAAVTVGILLARRGDSCAALALVSGPGTSPAHLLPWAGQVKLRSDVVPFREPAESQVSVDDYVPCAGLIERLGAREAEITEYIRGLLPNP
jgi:hypothetical protein